MVENRKSTWQDNILLELQFDPSTKRTLIAVTSDENVISTGKADIELWIPDPDRSIFESILTQLVVHAAKSHMDRLDAG